MDFNQRKSAKKNSKRMSQKTEDGRRIRGGKTVPRKQRGMCASDPPLPPKLREEDEARAAAERSRKKKEEKRKAAARALREKMAAKGVPGAAKPLSQMKGPNRGRLDDDEVSESDEADDEADETAEKGKTNDETEGVPEYFADALRALGHKGTTPIQRECWPHACAGRDLLGVAPPGSGKTLAYLLPAVEFALRDARDNPPGKKKSPAGEPSALVVAPTRELALQISAVCGKLRRSAPVRCVSVYGGASQEEQEEQLAQPSVLALLVVGTPGRLVATLESGALRLRRARLLVIDEADRMLALGFAEQLETIRETLPANERDSRDSRDETSRSVSVADAPAGMGSRPGRQTLMFSATFPKTVRAVAKAWLAPKPAIIKIEASVDAGSVVKRSNEANVAVAAGGKEQRSGPSRDASDVEQTVHVCAEHKKARKLLKHLTELRKNDGRSRSRVLVFANRIKTVNFVGETLRRHGEKVGCLHGELKQEKREAALRDFKSGKTPCLVATDVAGRGLDITGLEHVVNWDMPGSVEQYTHRVGRAGRSGRKGAALSFFTRNMAPLAPDLVKLLKRGGHFVDPNLEVLAKVGAALVAGEGADAGDVEADDANAPGKGSREEEEEASEDPSREDGSEEEEDDDDDDDDDDDSHDESEEDSEDAEASTEEESDDDDDDDDDDNYHEKAADALDKVFDELVDVFRSENGRDPTEQEMLRWMKTLRESGGGGPVSFEAMESDDGDEDEDDDDDDGSSESERAGNARQQAPPAPRRKRTADASRDGEAAAPPAKKPKEAAAGKAPPAVFVAAKRFAGAKPGYYFRKGAKGLGYYVDAAAPAVKRAAAASGDAHGRTEGKEKKSGVFSVPRERAEFQPAKRFAGAKPGFVFKKGARGLGYYLDRPPKVMWKGGGGGGGARRGDWAKHVGGSRRSGGKNKGGRGGRGGRF